MVLCQKVWGLIFVGPMVHCQSAVEAYLFWIVLVLRVHVTDCVVSRHGEKIIGHGCSFCQRTEAILKIENWRHVVAVTWFTSTNEWLWIHAYLCMSFLLLLLLLMYIVCVCCCCGFCSLCSFLLLSVVVTRGMNHHLRSQSLYNHYCVGVSFNVLDDLFVVGQLHEISQNREYVNPCLCPISQVHSRHNVRYAKQCAWSGCGSVLTHRKWWLLTNQ